MRTMKTSLSKFALGMLVSCFAFFNVNRTLAQGKYGLDSVKCVENISVYREYVKQGNYKDAYAGWKHVFVNCPASTEYMYLDGITIMKNMMANEKDALKQRAYVDTIMIIYDQRIIYYNKEGYVLGRKGVDMLNLYNDKIQEAYNTMKRAHELQGFKLEAAPADACFQAAVMLYKEGKINKLEAFDVFLKMSEVVSNGLKQKPGDKYYTAAQENIEATISGTDIADCKSLVDYYLPQFTANSNDPSLLKSITKNLGKANCTDSQLYLDAAVALDKVDPSAESKAAIAKMYSSKSKYSDAISYYNQAIEQETENDTKALYVYDLAKVYQKTGSLSSARSQAQKAASLKSNWGMPYILIGDLYASSNKECNENELTQKAVYWVAVDKYQQAKSIDPSLAEEANSRIGTYSRYFPSGETVFFFGLKEGDSYNLSCWINENTKVRAAK